MSDLKPLIYSLILVAYLLAFIVPATNTITSMDMAGARSLVGLQEEVRKLETSRAKKLHEVRLEEEKLTQDFGALRFTGLSNRTPLDSLLRAISESCSDLGVQFRSVTPMAKKKTGILELEGLQCKFGLPTERHFSDLLQALREKGRSRRAMVHGLRLWKGPTGLEVSIQFTILRPRSSEDRQESQSKVAGLEAWLAIQRETESYQDNALLMPRPRKKPVQIAKPAPKPAPRPTAPVTRTPPVKPSTPAFEGRLLGVASAGAEDAAILEIGGSQEMLFQGETTSGWTLHQLFTDRVVFRSGEQESIIYFNSEEADAKEGGEEPEATARKPEAAAGLGLAGVMRWIRGALRPPPPPYGDMKRVYAVTAVTAGSMADRAGLRPGDRILSLDGQRLRVGAQLRGLRTRLAQGDSARLDVERNRSIVKIAVTP